MDDSHATIAALSTPPGLSGIAVLRVSGPDALALLTEVLRTPRGGAFDGEWEHRRLYRGTIVAADGEPIDTAMCAVMRAPESYTGEDVVELSCHGGTLIVSRVLNLLFERGARPAEPGEFTKRAFLNGKMDLIQAEAVADLIHAHSELQRRVALEQLAGGLSSRIGELADQVLELLGVVEANIDFIEEGIDTLDRDGAVALLGEQIEALDDLLAGAALSRPFREGFRVAIAGPVNAGKSSLFNRLVGETRAIVTEIPGTTRDVLREPVVIDGLVFLFQDMAGMRGETADRVESIGLNLAGEAVRAADLVLFVVDVSEPVGESLAGEIRKLDGSRTLIVLNKIDLHEAGVGNTLQALPEGAVIARVSAVTGEGIGALRDAIVHAVAGEELSRIASERVVLNSRLVSLLEAAREKVKALQKKLGPHNQLELIALDAREILGLYEEATGRRYRDDLLDVIFSRFCIGK